MLGLTQLMLFQKPKKMKIILIYGFTMINPMSLHIAIKHKKSRKNKMPIYHLEAFHTISKEREFATSPFCLC